LNQEQEFKNKISEKNCEIDEVKKKLQDTERELLAIKNRNFWDRVKACFTGFELSENAIKLR
jgi:hypothetical protein